MRKKKLPLIVLCLFIIPFFSTPHILIADEIETPLSLKTVIHIALDANLDIENSRQESTAALAKRNESRTYFYPTFNATYQYQRNEEEITSPFGNLFIPPKKIIITPEEEFAFIASVTQPLFTGFSVLNQYKMAELGLDLAKTNEKLVRQDVILQATKAYYLILKAEKFVKVTKETVTQISAQKEVVNNFYKVGMSPLNDLLEAEVLLANAKQSVIRSLNDLESAKSQMNVILRRPVDQPIDVVDILDYDIFPFDLKYCLAQADENRLEIHVADMEIALAEKDIELHKKDYYPTVSLQGSYYRFGTDWDVNLGDDTSDGSTWDIKAVASWDFWNWGRSSYGVREKKSRLAQALLKKSRIQDGIHFKVKQAFLDMNAAEKKY